jgi:hypothetical protein
LAATAPAIAMTPLNGPRHPRTAGPPAAGPEAVAFARHLRRRDRELRTLQLMIGMHCRDRHAGDPLCVECAALAGYAARRLERCVFGAAKPTCANCKVHCYSADMRERVRAVMRYAGPRMLLRHPILGIAHVIDGRRLAPELPGRKERVGSSRPVEAGPTSEGAASG